MYFGWGIGNFILGTVVVVASVLVLVALQQYAYRRRLAARRRAIRAAASQRFQEQRDTHPPGEPLPAETRATLTTLSYKSSVPPCEERACPICLIEYEEGEELLALPCKHVFHHDCVGLWFDGHSTCPFCRYSFGAGTAEPGPEAGAGQPQVPVSTNGVENGGEAADAETATSVVERGSYAAQQQSVPEYGGSATEAGNAVSAVDMEAPAAPQQSAPDHYVVEVAASARPCQGTGGSAGAASPA